MYYETMGNANLQCESTRIHIALCDIDNGHSESTRIHISLCHIDNEYSESTIVLCLKYILY